MREKVDLSLARNNDLSLARKNDLSLARNNQHKHKMDSI